MDGRSHDNNVPERRRMNLAAVGVAVLVVVGLATGFGRGVSAQSAEPSWGNHYDGSYPPVGAGGRADVLLSTDIEIYGGAGNDIIAGGERDGRLLGAVGSDEVWGILAIKTTPPTIPQYANWDLGKPGTNLGDVKIHDDVNLPENTNAPTAPKG